MYVNICISLNVSEDKDKLPGSDIDRDRNAQRRRGNKIVAQSTPQGARCCKSRCSLYLNEGKPVCVGGPCQQWEAASACGEGPPPRQSRPPNLPSTSMLISVEVRSVSRCSTASFICAFCSKEILPLRESQVSGWCYGDSQRYPPPPARTPQQRRASSAGASSASAAGAGACGCRGEGGTCSRKKPLIWCSCRAAGLKHA